MKNDLNGELTLAPGMRSEYDDEVRPPAPQVPSVNDHSQQMINFVNGLSWKKAWLPADYDALNKAVASIKDLNLLKTLGDKTEALASYEHARRENEQAERNLKRATNRIWRQMGRLYRQVAAPGARTDKGNLAHARARSGAIGKGATVGHSRKQVETAIAMAEAPPAAFDAGQKADPPKSKTALAKEGRKARAATKPPPESLPATDPRSPANKAAGKLLNAAERFLMDMKNTSTKLALTPGALEPGEIETLLADYTKIEKVIARVRTALEACNRPGAS